MSDRWPAATSTSRSVAAKLRRMHQVREVEWAVARPYVQHRESFLDFGSGTGIIANLAARDFSHVEAVDVVSSVYRDYTIRLVTYYDGHALPFPENSFDVIFSSHAIYLCDQVAVSREFLRVLKPNGVIVHVVPSASSRVISILTQVLTLPFRGMRFLFKHRSRKYTAFNVSTDEGRSTRADVLGRILPASLAPGRSAFAEIRLFGLKNWRRTFQRAGWQIIAAVPTRTFASGARLFGPYFPMGLRRLAACAFGSHSFVFVLCRPDESNGMILARTGRDTADSMKPEPCDE